MNYKMSNDSVFSKKEMQSMHKLTQLSLVSSVFLISSPYLEAFSFSSFLLVDEIYFNS